MDRSKAWLAPLFGWLIAGLACFRIVGDPDAGWHLAYGRLIALQGLPRTNALAWTARDYPWYDFSWLWSWATYALDARLGLLGPQLLTFAVFGVAIFALGWACSRAPWLAIAGAFLLLPRLTVRPHVATWAGLALVLALCMHGGRRGRLLCVPLIALVGNLHPGALFCAGVLGLFCLEEFWPMWRWPELLIAALGVAAVCANPGGLFNLRSLLWHLEVQQVVVIGEYLPPSFGAEPVFFLLLPAAFILALLQRRERPAHLAALIIFATLALRSQRMVYEFEILALPLFAPAFSRLRPRPQALAAAALILGGAIGQSADRWLRPPYGPRWNPELLPVRAAAFARARGIEGRLFNSYDDGGYLEWAGYSGFVDGRVESFPREFFAAFYRASHGAPQFQAWLRSLDVEWAVPLRTSPWLSGRDLIDGPEWALVYWDDRDELFLRRDVERFAKIIESFEYKLFRPRGAIVGAVEKLAPAELPLLLREVDRFDLTTPGDPFALLVRCAALTRSSNPDASRICNSVEGRVPADLLAKARSLKP